MPLLDPSSDLSDRQVDELLAQQAQTLEQVLALAARPDVEIRGPVQALAIRELGSSLIALVERASAPGTPRPLRLAVLNASADGAVALIDLIKACADLPKVPRGPSAPRAPAASGTPIGAPAPSKGPDPPETVGGR
jgi:hypothetical protein